MKVVFFGGIPKKSVKDLSLSDITGTAALYTYFLRNEFDKRGIETDYCEARPGSSSDEILSKIQIPPGDHILSVAQRGFTVRCKTSKILYENARKAIKGKITSICDHATANPVEDIIFYAVPNKPLAKNVHIQWACDHSLLTPEQDPTKIRILIDHAYYGNNNPKDITSKLSEECVKFQYYHSEKKVIIRRFSGPTGVEDVNNRNALTGQYDRSTSMPYPKACEEYRKADIFIVTHPESLGLSVLESAAGGAFVVLPHGYIRSGMLSQIRHLDIPGNNISWDIVLNQLNIKRSVSTTKNFNWSNMTDKILKSLGE